MTLRLVHNPKIPLLIKRRRAIAAADADQELAEIVENIELARWLNRMAVLKRNLYKDETQ